MSGPLEKIIHRLIPVDSDQLISAVAGNKGSKYFLDEQCEECLKVLVDSCNAEAGLSIIGRIAVRQHLSELLATRFALIDYWQRTPEIQAQEIHPQIFITGLPKSGSTFLHRLLAHDSNNRAPEMWEVMFPLPATEGMRPGLDPRITKAENRLRWLRVTHSALVQAHPIGAHIPQECGAIKSFSFQSDVFTDMFSIPAYEAWLRKQDAVPSYEFHRSFLKHLQWLSPTGRWTLKSSDHIHNLRTLFQIYPKAQVIFLHRDPMKVLQAAASQQVLLKRLFSRSVDPRRLAANEVFSLHDKTQKIMEFCDGHVCLEDRLMDIRYRDLAADPIGTVHKIYDRFGITLTAEDEARMAAFADSERNKKRQDRFSLTDLGLDPEREYQKFNTYYKRFRLEREVM
jgi:LPS sulfotransferase NodH